ncbi:MAG: RNA methyltransferase [Symbiobacteriaceae bacterium]|nr:RNA methyltransferase [Symbiobacteriaceae bacterium]
MGKKRQEFTDSPEYLAKKAQFADMTTIYGRQVVWEALVHHPNPRIASLLLAMELGDERIKEFLDMAATKEIAVKRLPRLQLSRITKHRDEDQGIAADIALRLISPLEPQMQQAPAIARLLAVIDVTTPGNVGIIARSVAGAGLEGMVLPAAGTPSPTLPLVIKGSAGHIFRTRLFSVASGEELLQLAKKYGWRTYALATAVGGSSLFEHQPPPRAIYLLGNESSGLPSSLIHGCDAILHIPLANGVDSLNVAAAATLVAFHIR